MATRWSAWFGRAATLRLQRRIVPQLRWNQEIWGETVLENLPPNARWLDAGCGWRLLGRDLEPLAARMVQRARSAFGVDLDLEHLKRNADIPHRAMASLDRLPFPDDAFDVITCNMVLEHLPEPLVVFRELARVLAPRGVLMIHTPNTRNYLVAANRLAKKLLPRAVVLRLIRDGRKAEDIFPTFYRANSVKALRALAHSAGLQPASLCFLTQPQPYTRFFAPLAFFELLAMRATMTPRFGRFGATIVMSMRKPG